MYDAVYDEMYEEMYDAENDERKYDVMMLSTTSRTVLRYDICGYERRSSRMNERERGVATFRYLLRYNSKF